MGGYMIPAGKDTVAVNFSKAMATDLLREKMGFQGVMITDTLRSMPWGVEHLSQKDRHKTMILAGVDQILSENDPKYVIECVRDAGYRTMVTEEFGYHRLSDSAFKILPRFTIRSGDGLDKLKNIVEKRKIPLAGDYTKYLSLRLAKSLLGHKRYLRIKSLVLKPVTAAGNQQKR